jgi:hypothetical protein
MLYAIAEEVHEDDSSKRSESTETHANRHAASIIARPTSPAMKEHISSKPIEQNTQPHKSYVVTIWCFPIREK